MNEKSTPQSDRYATAIQIIAVAFIAGVVSFGLVSVFVTIGEEPDDPLMGYVAAGVSVVMVVISLVVPPAVAGQQVRQAWERAGENEKQAVRDLCSAFQTQTIIGLAMLEGAAFFNLVAYMITARLWSLAIAGALVVIMMSRFPTRTKIENWVATQRQLKELT